MKQRSIVGRFFTLLMALSPELLLLASIGVGVFYYNYMYQNFEVSLVWNILTFGSFLGLLNTTFYFFAMRPAKLFDKKFLADPDLMWVGAAVPVAFLLFFMVFLIIFPQLLAGANSYRGAQTFIGCGMLFAVVYIIIIFISNMRVTAENANIYKKFFVRHKTISIIAIVLLTLNIMASWQFADYNPSLQHFSYSAIALKNETGYTIPHESTCEVDVGVYKKSKRKYKCRARVTCSGTRLYGFLGDGVFNCRLSVKDGKTYIKGADWVVTDTDPAFRIDVKKRMVEFSRKHNLANKVEFKGHLTGK